MGAYLLGRLSEGSTWRGLVALVTAAGVHLSPDIQNQVIVVGLGIMGLIGMLWKEKGATA